MKTRIDVQSLYAALDAARRTGGKSWRGLAKEAGVGPSLFSRMANGYKPDADSFARLVDYLNVEASQFFTDRDEDADRRQPELVVQVAPLLRAHKELDATDVAYIEDVITATLKRARATANG